jgi:hypothetical protein
MNSALELAVNPSISERHLRPSKLMCLVARMEEPQADFILPCTSDTGMRLGKAMSVVL